MAGQTLSEIRGILAAAGLSPQRRFGQNFLIDLNLMRKLVDAAAPTPADVVLEVGPGTGSLTELLLEAGLRVIAIEVDRGLQDVLRHRFGGEPRFQLIAGSALDSKHAVSGEALAALTAAQPATGGARKLVANLPYQIATPLLMELLVGAPPLERMVCTIQREVGLRLRAAPGDSDYGPLAIAMQTLAHVEHIATLPGSVFWPAPKVDSMMVRIRARRDAEVSPTDAAAFVALVRDGFAHRRKVLRHAFPRFADDRVRAILEAAGVDPRSRPEALAPPTWIALFLASRAAP